MVLRTFEWVAWVRDSDGVGRLLYGVVGVRVVVVFGLVEGRRFYRLGPRYFGGGFGVFFDFVGRFVRFVVQGEVVFGRCFRRRGC